MCGSASTQYKNPNILFLNREGDRKGTYRTRDQDRGEINYGQSLRLQPNSWMKMITCEESLCWFHADPGGSFLTSAAGLAVPGCYFLSWRFPELKGGSSLMRLSFLQGLQLSQFAFHLFFSAAQHLEKHIILILGHGIHHTWSNTVVRRKKSLSFASQENTSASSLQSCLLTAFIGFAEQSEWCYSPYGIDLKQHFSGLNIYLKTEQN